MPGIWSHRFSAPDPTDEKNIAKLLHELAPTAITPERRSAHFHTTLVAAKPGRESLVVEADWDGYIALAPKGENGFGYDPIFMVDAFRTAAELSEKEKKSSLSSWTSLEKING